MQVYDFDRRRASELLRAYIFFAERDDAIYLDATQWPLWTDAMRYEPTEADWVEACDRSYGDEDVPSEEEILTLPDFDYWNTCVRGEDL